MPGRTDYSPSRVRALIEDYQAYRSRADTDRSGLRFLIQLADLDRVIAALPRGYREVVLLHGQLGLAQRTVARLLDRRQSSISERYENAVEEITQQLNWRF